MATFHATVVSVVPCYYEGEVEVEAENLAEARAKIREMYKEDEIDFNEGEEDYDMAQISEIRFTKETA